MIIPNKKRGMKNKMTLYEYLREKTGTRELCVIKEGGWTVATAYIDCEDLFQVPDRLRDMDVLYVHFDVLTVRDDANSTNELETVVKVPVRVIEVGKGPF